MLRDADATYHLRRILYFLQNFPSTLDIDPYVQFPHGSKIIWPGFLDVCFGLILWPVRVIAELFEADWMHAVTITAAWLPPLIGAATVVVAFSVARRNFTLQAALICGFLLIVLGGHFVYSQIGALDHHVVVSLASLLILGSMLRILVTNHVSVRAGALLGIWSGIALLVWPGSLLYVGIAFLGLVLSASLVKTDAPRPHAPEADSPNAHATMRSRFRALMIAGGTAALIVAPFSVGAEWPQWSAFSPVVLTAFQPWILGCAALVGFVGMHLSHRPQLNSAPLAIPIGLFTFSLLLLGASLLALDGLTEGLRDAWQWLGKGEEFQASVIESQGLFIVGGEYTTFMATLQLSSILYLFPLLWIYGAYVACVAKNAEDKEARFFLLGWSLLLFGITLLQKRFVNTFSIALALQAGLSISDFIRLNVRPEHRRRLNLAFAVAAACLLYSVHPNYTPHLRNIWNAFHDMPPVLNRFQRADFIATGMGRWIREFTPTTSGWLDKNTQPEYGIMASWGHGHMLQHVARRPTVTDNFGDDAGRENFELEKQYWAMSNHESAAILDRLGVRYVIVTGGNPLLPSYAADATYRSLYLYDGGFFKSKNGRTPASPRYRLVRESQKLQSNLRYAFIKVFEFVPGARIQGRTRAGQRIQISVQVRTAQGRDFFYRDEQVADESGAFEFVVAYPNSGGPTGLIVASVYRVVCGQTGRVAEITETDIQTGAKIPIENPCLKAPSRNPL